MEISDYKIARDERVKHLFKFSVSVGKIGEMMGIDENLVRMICDISQPKRKNYVHFVEKADKG